MRSFTRDSDNVDRITLHVAVRITRKQLKVLHKHRAFKNFTTLADAIRDVAMSGLQDIEYKQAVVKHEKQTGNQEIESDNEQDN